MSIRPEYLTLDQLLANRLFRIPRYQRVYSWQHDQRADMFRDIKKLKDKPTNSFHFMATVVGLRRETTTIVTDQYNFIDIVDGQQRLTTLVLLLKAIEQKLDCEVPTEKKLAQELRELLVKQDELSLILLQTNHDQSQYFTDYLRYGTHPPVEVAQTLADSELLRAINECENFVNSWDNRIELLRIIKNQLTFIFHDIGDEAAVYTVFEVLNNRGLAVSSLDKLKSQLMSVAFEDNQGNSVEHINELHRIWGDIYETLGLRQGLITEALRFGATLRHRSEISSPLGEESSVESLMRNCGNTAASLNVSNWLLKVIKAFDELEKYINPSRKAVTKIVHARLLGVAITLRESSSEEKRELLNQWEKTTFRIFGLCKKDARTGKGDYVKLAWKTLNNQELNTNDILSSLINLSESYPIHDVFFEHEDCYSKWDEELRYLMFRYEEHLAQQRGQKLCLEQWNRVWQESTAKSIEHIFPQSKGSEEPLEDGQEGVYVHRLGNLLLLPLGENSRLSDKDPEDKVEAYKDTGFFIAREVAHTIGKNGWGAEQVEEREKKILEWVRQEWS